MMKVIIGILAAAAIWYFGSPLLFNTVVNEELPTVESKEVVDAVIASGLFKGTDAFHKGEGSVTIYSSGVVRFEDFSVTNGPALNVWLVRHPEGDPNLGYIDLGELKGNIGNQNYQLPEGVDMNEFASVIIRCIPFKVTFAVAKL